MSDQLGNLNRKVKTIKKDKNSRTKMYNTLK